MKIKKMKAPVKYTKKSSKKKRQTNSKALAVVAKEKPQGGQQVALSLANPQDVMAFGQVLKGYIVKNSLSTNINGKDYAHVDAWKYAGISFGLTAIPSKPVAKHDRGQYITVLYVEREFQGKGNTKYKKDVVVFCGYSEHHDIIAQVRTDHKIVREITKPCFAYECEVDVVRIDTQQRVSYGVGFCSNLELLKTGFDEYSVNSMSQTRGIGKAFRNLLGFVMNAAGMEATPAEEMDEVKRGQYEDAQFVPDAPRNKPLCSAFHFKQILERVMQGKFDVEQAKEHMTFSEDQLEAIKIADDSFKQQHPQ
jgi:hypothetical protein